MSYTYFMRPVGMTGPVKIGVSDCPRLRLDEYGRWSPFPLEIVAVIEGPLSLEKRFHAKFLHLHTHFEWFREDAELLLAIEQINEGTFDVSTLPSGIHLYQKVRKEGGPRRVA